MYIVENVVNFTCGGLSKFGLAPGLMLEIGPDCHFREHQTKRNDEEDGGEPAALCAFLIAGMPNLLLNHNPEN